MDETLINTIKEVLNNDERVIFAYLHGSAIKGSPFNDIDIAVFSEEGVSPYELSSDLKVALYKSTGIPADAFDIHIINDMLYAKDIFALLFLKNIFFENILLVDKAFDLRANFIESYGKKYRECEGLITELLS